MGCISVDKADITIVTDDNPRSESPSAIRSEILASAMGAREIGSRGEAIATACGYRFVEGDALHREENIRKMSAGIPLPVSERRITASSPSRSSVNVAPPFAVY